MTSSIIIKVIYKKKRKKLLIGATFTGMVTAAHFYSSKEDKTVSLLLV